MALPSSPPLVPQDLVDESYQLPNAPSLPHGRPANLKRQLSEYTSLSSDPLFSEDASEADVQAYQERRKKKRTVRGPWWRHGSQLKKKPTRQQDKIRNIDSGVWMGSDASDDTIASNDSQESDISTTEHVKALQVEDETVVAVGDYSAEQMAERIVQTCLDRGKEVIDLSDLELSTLSGATVQPLHHLVRAARRESVHPPSEDEFAPFTPSIKLFLSGNRLHSLPAELFLLENLTVLSLRNNRLHELPATVTSLRNLRELNVAGNGLEWLPFELLAMFECREPHVQLTVRPNPLLEPCAIGDSSRPENVALDTMRSRLTEARQLHASCHDTMKNCCSREVVCLAVSSISLLNIDGSSKASINGKQSLTGKRDFSPVFSTSSDTATTSDRVSSLFELSLRSTSRTFDLGSLTDSSLASMSPSMQKGLRLAAQQQQSGELRCNTCSRQYIVPRAEWMEYWFIGARDAPLTAECILPFLRKACCWGCAQPSEIGSFR